ncbi:hypothetical protein JW721_06000 [Candidatus Micrarchaeota archaeon]|nr:hypothetical protein [Candidatus Micrarchaeota archaeon]
MSEANRPIPIPAGRQKPGLKRGRLNFKLGRGSYGINWGSKKSNPEGTRRLAGINFHGLAECQAKTQAGINLSAVSVSSHQGRHAGSQYGVNAALASTRRSTFGLNMSLGSIVYRAQSGINLGVFQCGRHSSASQNGISIGALNVFPKQRGINIGALNIANQFGINIGLVNQDSNQIAYCTKGGTRFRGQKGVTLGLTNAVDYQDGVSFGVIDFVWIAARGLKISIFSFVEKLRGVALGAFLRINDAKGMALSAVSKIANLTGLSVSALHASAQTLSKGVLIAPITRVDEGRNSTGLQIGLLNIRNDARIRYLPLIAISVRKTGDGPY